MKIDKLNAKQTKHFLPFGRKYQYIFQFALSEPFTGFGHYPDYGAYGTGATVVHQQDGSVYAELLMVPHK